MGNQSQPDARVRKDLGLPERYAAVRHIASGGMASVWCARDRALGRNVAIKLLAERFADDEEANARFLREARAAARLSGHPNVVMIYDVGETDADGRAFIVMEFLAGGTVADAIRVDSVRRVHAVKWVQEAASALDFAHSRGVLHRDIKPANLLLDRARTLHVADFGIARLGAEDTITGTGQVLGTASYLAPERALGQPATAASDRYSLAVAAFELLVGERPFTAQHFAAQARQHIEEEPPAASRLNRTLPESVDAVLARGMAKRPEQRWPTAQDFAQALESALTEATTKAHQRIAAAGGRAAPEELASNRHAATDRCAAYGASGRVATATDRVARARGRAAAPAPPRADPGAGRARARSRRRGRDRRHDRQRGGGRSAQRSASVQRQASAATHKRSPAPREAGRPEAANDPDADRHGHARRRDHAAADRRHARGARASADARRQLQRGAAGAPTGRQRRQPGQLDLRLRAVRLRPCAAARRRSEGRGQGALPAAADPQPDRRGQAGAAARARRARAERAERWRRRRGRAAGAPSRPRRSRGRTARRTGRGAAPGSQPPGQGGNSQGD